MWQAYNVEVLQCLFADKRSGNLRDFLRSLQLAVGADHQLLRVIVLLLLLRHCGMQYRARTIAERSGLSCNLIKSIARPRWTLNIAENGVAFCGGAEASSANHLMFARPPCLILHSLDTAAGISVLTRGNSRLFSCRWSKSHLEMDANKTSRAPKSSRSSFITPAITRYSCPAGKLCTTVMPYDTTRTSSLLF